MPASPDRKPCAVCTKCGIYGRSMQFINEQCGQRVGKKRCQGVMGSALENDDWIECPSCDGNDRSCPTCQGTGWRYNRRR